MTRSSSRRRAAVGLLATAGALLGAQLVLAGPGAAQPATGAALSSTRLSPTTKFYVPPAQKGAVRQFQQLLDAGDYTDAALISAMEQTPQAVWLDGGTAAQVRMDVRVTSQRARLTRTVPTFVAYNAPGRDCSQYSSGGAGSDAAYRAWADGVAAGLVRGQQVVVVVEPDGLANLPSDCPSAYPGQDVAALTAGRIADIHYIGAAVEAADPAALVYLDAGHSAWHSVGDIAQRLSQAGVGDFAGFSLNVSNYQPTPQLDEYGSWVSKCLWYASVPAPGEYGNCASQYYPANPNDYSTWHLTDEWYAGKVDALPNAPTADQLAHAVIDTSRNGQGPWTPTASYPDPQTWCNPPGRGLGLRPTANTGQPLVDAYLWIKTPGQSDGQCNRGVAGSTTDPAWGGIVDPAAGAWFPQQALQLVHLANPPLVTRP